MSIETGRGESLHPGGHVGHQEYAKAIGQSPDLNDGMIAKVQTGTKHEFLSEEIYRIQSVVERLDRIHKAILGDISPGNQTEQPIPPMSLQQLLDHGPGELRELRDRIHSQLDEIEMTLFGRAG